MDLIRVLAFLSVIIDFVLGAPIYKDENSSALSVDALFPFKMSAVIENEETTSMRSIEDITKRSSDQPEKPESETNLANYHQSQGFKKWLNETREMYDNRLRPLFGTRPLSIKLGMFLIGISSISEAKMEFTVELFFHETWTDERLRFNPKDFGGSETITLPLDAPSWLWLPDTSFLNALRSLGPEYGSVSHLYYMRLNYTGSIQLSVTAECQMDLTMYPFDQQACRLELSSYGFTMDDIIYEWALYPNSIPLDIQLQDFYTDRSKCYTRVETKTYVAGNFSAPIFCMELKRRWGFCMIQLFVPATAVVASSWISLWLQSQTQFADMVSIILAIIFLSYSYNNVMPKVSYVKAMDIYLIACFIFAFLSLVKLAIVKYMHNKVSKRKQLLQAAGTSLIHLPSLFDDLADTAGLGGLSRNNADLSPTDPMDRTSIVSQPILKKHSLAAGAFQASIPPPPSHAHRDRYWKCMRAFHVGSQLVLPLAFGAFGIFYFFIYPHVKAPGGSCKRY